MASRPSRPPTTGHRVRLDHWRALATEFCSAFEAVYLATALIVAQLCDPHG